MLVLVGVVLVGWSSGGIGGVVLVLVGVVLVLVGGSVGWLEVVLVWLE